MARHDVAFVALSSGTYETLADARAGVERYVNHYHHHPHQFLGYRTPKEVRQTWEDAQDQQRQRNQAA